MKPHIRIIHGIWHCSLRIFLAEDASIYGMGYTPLDAYKDWMTNCGRV